MFKKMLVANRGEVAVRIINACRDLGIKTVALYTESDQSSLHVRLAEMSLKLNAPDDFLDREIILSIAHAQQVDAIHPGIGFLAEIPEFVHDCEAAGITFIGPTASAMETVHDRVGALTKAREAGIPTVQHSTESFGKDDFEALRTTADALGYPLIVKSCRGGRGTGERWVKSPDKLEESVRRAQVEAENVYGDSRVYLERAIPSAHQIGVQIVADRRGNCVHLGEREGSIIFSNRKFIDETPSPNLSAETRQQLCDTALALANLFLYDGVGTVEFLVDKNGNFYFTEFKPRLQTDHPLTELITRIDIVRQQIRIALGEPLPFTQTDVHFHGHAMMCRIQAEDTTNNFLASPGELKRVRFPSGHNIRVDTYVYCHCYIPEDYSRLFAKLAVWDEDRASCLKRFVRAVQDVVLIGTHTNIPLIQQVIHSPAFMVGEYSSDFSVAPLQETEDTEAYLRNLAIAAAMYYVSRNQTFTPSTPSRLLSGWHRSSRRLPQ